MRINWKLRLQNRTTLAALTASIVSLVYLILETVGIVPCITESEVTALIAAVLNLLVMLGVLVDPTTEGVRDSDRALGYDCPACHEGSVDTSARPQKSA